MKISSKGRYGIASMISIAQVESDQERVSVISISKRLDISKIFLEQVFTMLRRGGLVTSVKGAQGGYRLARPASEISAYDILAAIETALFEEPESTVKDSAPGIETAMRELLFLPADEAFSTVLKNVSLMDLANEAENQLDGDAYMYYL